MTKQQKQQLAYVIMTVAVVVCALLGVNYPLPDSPAYPLARQDEVDALRLKLSSIEQVAGGPLAFTASGSGEGYTNFTSVNVEEDLYVGDDVSIIGDLDAASVTVSGSGATFDSLTVSGAAALNGGITVDTDAFIVADTTGNTTITTGTLTVGGAADVGGALNYGANNMYPLGYATTGYELVCGTAEFTGTNQTISVSGLTAVTYVVATMSTDPGTGAGDPALIWVDAQAGSAANFVANCVQDDWTTAATSAVTIQYCAVGTE